MYKFAGNSRSFANLARIHICGLEGKDQSYWRTTPETSESVPFDCGRYQPYQGQI